MWLPPSLQSRQRQAAIKVGSVLNSNLMAPHAHFAVCFFAMDHLRCVGTVERRFEKSIWFSATPIAGHVIRVRERPAWGCLEVIGGWPGVFHHRHQVWRHRWDFILTSLAPSMAPRDPADAPAPALVGHFQHVTRPHVFTINPRPSPSQRGRRAVRPCVRLDNRCSPARHRHRASHD